MKISTIPTLVFWMLLVSASLGALPHNIPDYTVSPTITSVQDGEWDNPETWGGVLPGPDDVVRINHIVVHTEPTVVSGIGVTGFLISLGELAFSDMIVYEEGSLLTADSHYVIRDTPIDDPYQWGNGIIVLGSWIGIGQAKTEWTRGTQDLLAGDTQIQLQDIPIGWQVGDRLGIAATNQNRILKNFVRLDRNEEAVIAGINGSTVTLAAPLQFDHLGTPVNPLGIVAYAPIANLTRSTVVESENPDGARGHVAITEDGQCQLSNIEFRSLGRTLALPVQDAPNSPNQIGRYPLHLHHSRVPAELTGCVISDGLKWGYTIHLSDSNIFQRCIAWNCDGAGFATEGGPESGNQFIDCFAGKIDGGYQTGGDRAGVTQNACNLPGCLSVDSGSEGSGFWFRGPVQIVNGCIAAGCAGHGYNFNAYWHDENFLGTVMQFSDNEAVSCRGGFWATWSQGCCNINVYQDQLYENLLFWNCSHTGIDIFHERNQEFRNVVILFDPAISEINQGPGGNMDVRSNLGIKSGNPSYQNHNLVLDNVSVINANIGISTPVKSGEDGANIIGGTWSNYVDFALLDGSGPDEVFLSGVEFLPTLVDFSGKPKYPATPTMVWQEGVGVLDPADLGN